MELSPGPCRRCEPSRSHGRQFDPFLGRGNHTLLVAEVPPCMPPKISFIYSMDHHV